MSLQQTTVNVGGEVTAFAGLVSGFLSALPTTLTVIALAFSIVWYAIHIYDWYILHRTTTTVTTETHSLAGILPVTKTTTETVSTSKKVDEPPEVISAS
jgi:hypothetical protein